MKKTVAALLVIFVILMTVLHLNDAQAKSVCKWVGDEVVCFTKQDIAELLGVAKPKWRCDKYSSLSLDYTYCKRRYKKEMREWKRNNK